MSNSEILKLVNKNEWDKAIKKLENINDVIHNDFRLIHYAVQFKMILNYLIN